MRTLAEMTGSNYFDKSDVERLLAAEREACAKVAESVAWSNRDGHMIGTAHNVACRDIAAAIRARSASGAGGPSQ